MSKKKEVVKVRIVWADVNDKELKKLREQVKMSFNNPNYTLITNYEVHWEEIKIIRDAVHLVWADTISPKELENLKKQVDLALSDPTYVIISNYEIHWEEIGARVQDTACR